MASRIIGAGLILAAFVFAAGARADEIRVPVLGHDVISSPEGERRILLQIGSLDALHGMAVGRAVLEVAVPMGLEAGVEQEVRAYPITTAWTPGSVDWTTGWSEPGGDFLAELCGRGIARRSADRSTFEVDLTSMVISILDGTEAFGLLVTVPPHDGIGFDGTAGEMLAGVLANAHLDVVCRSVRRPPSRS